MNGQGFSLPCVQAGYGRRLKAGEDYKNLDRTVIISILSYNLFEEQIWSSYHSCFAVLNTKDLRHKLSEERHFSIAP